MDVVFLKADKPIIKSYELNEKRELVKHSYPHIHNFTSIPVSVQGLHEFSTQLTHHAKQGHCLLKGAINRPLENESRAGSTDRDTPTQWVCLDVDGVQGFETLDDFLAAIGCHGVDYIVQWSSSMGLEADSGLRCHVFMMLDKEAHPHLLKLWLMHLNLSVPALAGQLQLTKTGNSLLWPLDITTCQNDKLLYIAPPLLGKGIKDPYPSNKRIQHVRFPQGRTTLLLPYPIPTIDALREQMDVRINELRVTAGMSKRKKTKYKYNGSVEYIVSPDTATITGIKTERGFTYFNLNGGDSWGYYHPEDDATFIYNFKGEPAYRTADLLPEYWSKIQPEIGTPNAQGLIVLAFRDFQSSTYYNGTFDQATNKLKLAAARSETQLRHFMRQHNQTLGEFVPDWDLIWEPKNPLVVDLPNQKLNTYQPSELLSPTATLPRAPKNCPSTINKVITHVLGDDPATVAYFMNWLASIVQDMEMTGTAWVLQGCQGTGKGVLYNHILAPLFGHQNTVAKRMEEIESEFTGFLENKLIVFIDEIEKSKDIYQSKVDAKLRTLIAEPEISIRKMHMLPYMVKNYCNMIFASNQPTPVDIPPDDRRFNVGLFQAQPLRITPKEIYTDIPAELPAFVSFMRAYKVNTALLRTPLINEAKKTLISTNRTALDTVVDAIAAGDLAFFWDHLPSSKQVATDNLTALKLQGFRSLLISLVTTLSDRLTRDELYILFDWCVGNIPHSPNKFAALLKHHRVHLEQVWKHERNVRGVRVTWKPDAEWLEQARSEIANNAI